MANRLNKYIATNMGISRREADVLIESARVKINGKLAQIGDKVEDNDAILIDDKALNISNMIYLMLNKPVGYVSSRKKQGTTPTLYELLPKKYKQLKTVGRLDKDSSGLILLTNDGDFTFRMTHPSFVKEKKYIVELNRALDEKNETLISTKGAELTDGLSKLGLKALDNSRKKWLVTMHEGRNRQIRRTFAALGLEVISLHRISFGNYELENLTEGKFKEVDKR